MDTRSRGRYHAEEHEQFMVALGLHPKREVTRSRIRVRAAMAAHARLPGKSGS